MENIEIIKGDLRETAAKIKRAREEQRKAEQTPEARKARRESIKEQLSRLRAEGATKKLIKVLEEAVEKGEITEKDLERFPSTEDKKKTTREETNDFDLGKPKEQDFENIPD